MPRTTKLDRLRAERTEALATLKRAEEAHRIAVAALPETFALAAARRGHEAASIAFIREHERTQRRAEVRTEYAVREIDADGDALDCLMFSNRPDALRIARKHLDRGAVAVAVERQRDGVSDTVWKGGDAAALAAWEDDGSEAAHREWIRANDRTD
jgi:hypothetical protein